MWCLISLNSVIIEIQVDPKAIGQECLMKVCEGLGISNEADYFGLKYTGHKGEELWLNLRNPIDRQVGNVSPLRFALKVKFWVPPNLILQETTRHQFYLAARKDLLEKKLQPADWESTAHIIALLSQAETGDYDAFKPPHHFYLQCSEICPEKQDVKPENFLQKILLKHKELHGMKQSAAEYWLLKEISAIDSFGEELFMGKPPSNLSLGVGPHGISVYQKDCEKQSIPYTAIQTAQSQKRVFKLEYLNQENEASYLEIKLESSPAASGLYRAITEKHAFYSCETVRSAVTAQFIRDLKGTIISIFNEDSSLGKKYVFDIRRTCREVYDNARRAIYQAQNEQQSSASSSGTSSRRMSTEDAEDLYLEEGGECCSQLKEAQSCDHCRDNKCDETRERLVTFIDALTCHICMDQPIDSAFLPCAHALACVSCAKRCEVCPLCRGEINQVQKIFLPLHHEQDFDKHISSTPVVN
ncbi:E3 ubiquitin-protein ligase MYLIP [Chrysoperla carnea]|uniref:E3 ubiquitin-protein ligase MYLIP n=1 Tax=Chrysoperla carnea TaxID=189513 RepID=UPI001D0671FE|nr:E3 ubiquitin-protein ligase MYLIP [Chrysoperla carnea]